MNAVAYWLISLYGSSYDGFWVAAEDFSSNNEYLWYPDMRPVNISFWALGEPYHSSGDCANFLAKADDIGIATQHCSDTHYVLCKI